MSIKSLFLGLSQWALKLTSNAETPREGIQRRGSIHGFSIPTTIYNHELLVCNVMSFITEISHKVKIGIKGNNFDCER